MKWYDFPVILTLEIAMLDKIGFACCIAGALLGVASVFWLGWSWGVWAIALFVLGLLLQWLAKRDKNDVGEAIGEAIVDASDLFD